MTMMVNNSARVIHVGGVMLVPGVPADVPPEALDNEQVQALMEAPVEGSDKKVLEATGDPKSSEQKSAIDADKPQHQAGQSGTGHQPQQQPAAQRQNPATGHTTQNTKAS